MAAQALEFPMHNLTATVAGVFAVSLVLAAVGPAVRATRDTQRAWSEAKAASIDCVRKFEKLQKSLETAKEAIALLDSDPNTAVQAMQRAKHATAIFLDDAELALLAVDTMLTKVRTLKAHAPRLRMAHPDFEQKLGEFERSAGPNLESLRDAVEKIHEQHFLEQFDESLAFIVEATTNHVLTQSRVVAAQREAPSVEEALASLKKIHEHLPPGSKKRTA